MTLLQSLRASATRSIFNQENGTQMKWYEWLQLIPLSIYAWIQFTAWLWLSVTVASWYYNGWFSIDQELPEYHYLVAAVWYMWTNQVIKFIYNKH